MTVRMSKEKSDKEQHGVRREKKNVLSHSVGE